jgi:hypothetical protein
MDLLSIPGIVHITGIMIHGTVPGMIHIGLTMDGLLRSAIIMEIPGITDGVVLIITGTDLIAVTTGALPGHGDLPGDGAGITGMVIREVRSS